MAAPQGEGIYSAFSLAFTESPIRSGFGISDIRLPITILLGFRYFEMRRERWSMPYVFLAKAESPQGPDSNYRAARLVAGQRTSRVKHNEQTQAHLFS